MINLHDGEACRYLSKDLLKNGSLVRILVLCIGYDQAEVELEGAPFVLFLIQNLYRQSHVHQVRVQSQRTQLSAEVFIGNNVKW